MNKKLVIVSLLIACLCFAILINIKEGFEGNSTNATEPTTKISNNLNDKIDAALKEDQKTKDKSKSKSKKKVKVDKNTIKDMLDSLEQSEQICNELDRRQNELNDKKLLEAQKRKLSEIELQEAKIIQLTEVLNNLRREKNKKDRLYDQCDSNIQEGINNQYNNVKTLVEHGLQDESYNVNLDLTSVYQKYLNSQKDKQNEHKHHKVEKIIKKVKESKKLPSKDNKILIDQIKEYTSNPSQNKNLAVGIIDKLNMVDSELKNEFLTAFSDESQPRYQIEHQGSQSKCPHTNGPLSDYISTDSLSRCDKCNPKIINQKIPEINRDFNL